MTMHNKKAVSLSLLRVLIAPLATNPDDDDYVRPTLDGNDRESITNYAIRGLIKPFFDDWDEMCQDMAKNTLRYFLNFPPKRPPHENFYRRLLDSEFAAIDAPDDPRLFFVWLWEELFGPEDYHLDSPEEYVIQRDRDLYFKVTLRE